MKVAVFHPPNLPHSISGYVQNLARELNALGIRIVSFERNEPVPEKVDVCWDPRAAGGTAPYARLRAASKPLVVTVHGAGPFSLPAREVFHGLRSALLGRIHNLKKRYDWRAFRGRVAAIITVSAYAREELSAHLRLPRERIVPIHHGVDHALFRPALRDDARSPYLLHLSSFRPKKNIERIISAYARLPRDARPGLVAVVPGYPRGRKVEGLEIVRTPFSQQKIAGLYQGALGFVFPSLHESFGMPIVEAMACGCAVITSKTTACPEVAGDAALLVDPRSVGEIADAMGRLITDEALREELRQRALKRAAAFTWRQSAEAHLAVFQKAAGFA